jgi:hypothetical protein
VRDTPSSKTRAAWTRWLPWAIAAVIAVGGLVAGATFGIKAKAVIACVVTLAYDPLTSKVSVSADPLHLTSRFVSSSATRCR